jgi:hypothetical protein
VIALLEKLGQGRPDRERVNLLFDPAQLGLEPPCADSNEARFWQHDPDEEQTTTQEREGDREALPVA